MTHCCLPGNSTCHTLGTNTQQIDEEAKGYERDTSEYFDEPSSGLATFSAVSNRSIVFKKYGCGH